MKKSPHTERVTQLLMSGLSPYKVHLTTGAPRQTCYDISARILGRRQTKTERIKQMLASGIRPKEIYTAVDCHPQTVYNIRRDSNEKANRTPPHRPDAAAWTAPEVEQRTSH